jgi:3'-phosphoadenosine 5'-phosphosulfate sulfotransferase (PAPS reductase)/FAD synthetase
MNEKIIAWWSGGVTSAVACKLTIDLYGKDNVQIIFIDTKNEHEDTYRFKDDCQKWYEIPIGTITGIGDKYNSVQDVWIKNKSLNVAHGAICSSELKRRVREKWEKELEFKHQVFGFDMDEPKRAKSMKMNHKQTKPLFPLLMFGYNKKDCINIIENAGIEVPEMYKLGFLNNNCFKTGCVQGGIGYWQKMKREFPEKFEAMAELKGKPVTMLKDQSNKAKQSSNQLIFLKPHKDYPMVKDISMIKGREPEPLFECNGFCGVNDLEKRNNTEGDINFQMELF